MKKILLLATLVSCLCCSKEETIAPIDQLPEATTEGLGTFGCLVNGKAYIDDNGGYLNAAYQYSSGGWNLNINGFDSDYEKSTEIPRAMYLQSYRSEDLQQGTYTLGNYEEGGIYGKILMYGDFLDPTNVATTNNEGLSGEITFTRFDKDTSNIVSGNFWFDVINPNTGDTLHITDGRFDTRYLN